ncbi:MAG: hypothetical protein JO356_00420 [Acidobacteria bacterium]|nr:hypothetical protein [Acidobacteriota bacterium]
MKYGADTQNEVASLIQKDISKLEPFLGKLTLDSIDYAAPHLTEEKDLISPAWVVKVHPAGQDEAKAWTGYILTFSVFDGVFEGEQTTLDPAGATRSQ